VAPTVGQLADDAVTADTTPTLSGQVSGGPYSGLKVRVSRSGGGPDADAVVSVNATTGQWTYTEPALSSGPYTYRARVESESGVTFGASTVTRRITISVLPAFLPLTGYDDNVDLAGTRLSGESTDDTTPTLNLRLTAGLSAPQSIRVVIVNGATETPITSPSSILGPSGSSVPFTPDLPLVDLTWTRGNAPGTYSSTVQTYVLRAIVTDASGARNQSNDVSVRVLPRCVHTFASHFVPTPTPPTPPDCSSCHRVGGTASDKGPGRTCRLQ
jgi:hypothetical protein